MIPAQSVEASANLEELDRLRDDNPHRAAQALRTLDTRALDAAALSTATFLLAHVPGETAIAQSWSAESLRAWFANELAGAPGLGTVLRSAT